MSGTLSTPIDRARKLIALSASDNQGEARNAAYQACRLIREHGLELVAKRESERFVHWYEKAPFTDPYPGGDPFAGVNHKSGPQSWADVGQSQAARNVQEWADELYRRARAEQTSNSYWYRAASQSKPKRRGNIIPTRRRHRCQACGERVEWQAFYSSDGEWFHPECVDRSGA